MKWYKVKRDGFDVTSIEELDEEFEGQDAEGQGICAYGDSEIFLDAAEVASFNDTEMIASFDEDVMETIIECLNDGCDVELEF